MIAGEQGTEVAGETFLALLVAVLVELDTIKGMDIDVVETGFHRSVEYAVLWIGQMRRQTGRTARELIVRKHPDILVSVNGIRADEQLIRSVVDHPVCRCSTDAFRTYDLLQTRSDLVKLVIRAERLMRRIGNHPQVPLPRHYGTGTALALGVVVRQMRVDSAEAFVSRFVDG